ncbi:alpha-fucosidase [Cohnella sp. CIP 111063]|uniref:alpha-L-fucosidase n=1 Tax=unclassified Cohnella TaxID=2636738 RepID=UPI000B8C0CA6|nr:MULTISPECIES: alpha-L-fucosidase [unclassified Cohnella]OXS58910.1 alpha-fucosidase [Cohnella sp. CIP 111063]PRX72007.1 alpha-L-fucosidase [Cohnella sp. SGD-V74]
MGVSIREAARIAPSPRQLAWQELEFYAFIHFTVNTFTDMEWGLGDESPSLFNPSELDARQWVAACQAAGMKGLILTCKHHDGFCLWPSAYTEHSVKSSPWRGGQGDLVREVSDACREAGLKFGVYLSPWDRHEPSYGDSPAYNAFFLSQLRELLTGYGELFCVWFDGACGEGANGKRQVYDWDAYYGLIRELQPNAVISVCGPDVRWCGNEAGHTRKSEWSVVPATMRDNEKIQANSQQADDGEFAKRVGSEDEDLGSRAVLAGASEAVWYPAETNTSIRPGWFYHAAEDDRVKTADELMELYERTVGGNSTFLLNLPPDRRGLLHENDVARMKELGERIRRTYGADLASGASVQGSAGKDAAHGAERLTDGDRSTFWQAPEGAELAEFVIELGSELAFDRVVLAENIREGQRIERFRLEASSGDGEWRLLYEGTVVGYKKICRFAETTASRLRLTIEESRWSPTLTSVGVYRSVAVEG